MKLKRTLVKFQGLAWSVTVAYDEISTHTMQYNSLLRKFQGLGYNTIFADSLICVFCIRDRQQEATNQTRTSRTKMGRAPQQTPQLL
jgi:hypothetical protein